MIADTDRPVPVQADAARQHRPVAVRDHSAALAIIPSPGAWLPGGMRAGVT